MKQALVEGRVEVLGAQDLEAEFCDVTTEECFPYLDRLSIDSLPSAYLGQRQCQVFVNDQTGLYTIDCREAENSE